MAMHSSIPGIHHVTAIAGDPQRNIDFYCGVLGLRLVKLTVNFDDPGRYHLYYGDEIGRPGTIVTFFAWPDAVAGRRGPPQVTAIAFAAPEGALDYWISRLREQAVESPTVHTRFGEQVLAFADRDGLPLEIVFAAEPGGEPWSAGPVSPPFAIRGLQGVTIAGDRCESTGKFLEDAMGLRAEGAEGNRFRYRTEAGNGPASVVDLLCVPGAARSSPGAGTVHHLAFRTPDDVQQEALRSKFADLGFNPSPVMDRSYFRSIYLREPGGVLIEIATDAPGFTADQSPEQLGARLMLPPWLEHRRKEIESALPPVQLPGLR